MQPIRSIAEIPFHREDVLTLLNLHERRDQVDRDYYFFGYARCERICLLERRSPEPLPLVKDALVLALHAAEDPEELDDDIELEFFIDEVADDYSVTVLLSDFLGHRLPSLLSDERAVILTLCNPHGATLPALEILGATPLYYAVGDVESWNEGDEARPFIQLVADEWREAR